MDMAPQFFFTSVGVTAAFSFVAVMVWLGHRKKEREEYYRSDTMKKIAESGSSAAAIEYLRETERIATRRTRARLRFIGLVVMSAGIGLTPFLWAISYDRVAGALVGVIALLVGASIFAFGQFMVQKD